MFHVKHLFFCRTTLSRLFHVKHRCGIGRGIEAGRWVGCSVGREVRRGVGAEPGCGVGEASRARATRHGDDAAFRIHQHDFDAARELVAARVAGAQPVHAIDGEAVLAFHARALQRHHVHGRLGNLAAFGRVGQTGATHEHGRPLLGRHQRAAACLRHRLVHRLRVGARGHHHEVGIAQGHPTRVRLARKVRSHGVGLGIGHAERHRLVHEQAHHQLQRRVERNGARRVLGRRRQPVHGSRMRERIEHAAERPLGAMQVSVFSYRHASTFIVEKSTFVAAVRRVSRWSRASTRASSARREASQREAHASPAAPENTASTTASS